MSKLLREDKTEKVDYSYIYLMKPTFDRVMQRFQMGEKKYTKLNFRNCEDYSTYQESAIRHLIQAFDGETDEDHLSAAIVNILIVMDGQQKELSDDDIDKALRIMKGTEWWKCQDSSDLLS